MTVETYDAARKPACHECKSNEQDETRAPHRTRVSIGFLPLDTVLVDQVDDKVSKYAQDARYPVDEGDVHRR